MIPRCFVAQDAELGERVTISGTDGHHFARVLRVRPMEQLVVATSGKSYLAVVETVNSNAGEVCVRLDSQVESHEPRHNVFLVQGLPKGDKTETIVQKNTEVGAAGIVLFNANRSVARVSSSDITRKLTRWQKVAQEAASQSQRDRVPGVSYAADLPHLAIWLKSAHIDRVLLIDEQERSLSLKVALTAMEGTSVHNIAIVVGPEGGFDDAERQFWRRDAAAVAVTLGPRILRTETAGVATMAAVLYELSDFGA